MDNRTILARKFLYYSDLACLSVNDCTQFILDNYIYNTEEELISSLKKYEGSDIKTELDAMKYMMCESASKLTCDNRFYVHENIDLKNVSSIYEAIVNEYKKLGLLLDTYPTINLCDEFPFPYEKVNGVAIAPDLTDRVRYDIPFAIFIRRDLVDPTILPVIIAHELIHYFVSDEGLLARGLEEGLADFFAFFVIGPKVMPKFVVQKYFITKRLNPKYVSPRFRTYLDYIRYCLYIYSFGGITELTGLLKSGRQKIKETEIAISNGIDIPSKRSKFPSSAHEKEILDLAWSTINNHPIFELVSARSYLFIQTYDDAVFNQKFTSVYKTLLKEIENDIFGCVVNKVGDLEFEDFETLRNSKSLRFEIR